MITYAAFHPGDVICSVSCLSLVNSICCGLDVSYVQGMNDIAGRFLSVFKTEVETYWSLDRYIDKIKTDFLQETMLAKISKSFAVCEMHSSNTIQYNTIMFVLWCLFQVL